jgi:hypothetical protein
VRHNIPEIPALEAEIIRRPDGIYSGMASTRVRATAVLRFQEATRFLGRPSLIRERLEGSLNQFRFTRFAKDEVTLC